MIALVATCFVVSYIFIPGVLFRLSIAFFSSIKLKAFERTRKQEVTFGAAVALVPFFFALFGVWCLPVMRHYPFPILEGTYSERRLDYRHVAELTLASDLSRLVGCSAAQNAPCLRDSTYWPALNRVLRRQARFLSWYFAVIIIESAVFSLFAAKYGDWQIDADRHSAERNSSSFGRAAYTWVTRRFVLPNISEWQVLLTDFNWPKQDNVLVVVDVLQNDGHLYRGRMEDFFMDANGQLTGILLRNVDRFDLHSYRKAQERTDDTGMPVDVDRDNFWKGIPSENFYIGQSSISNLNIRFSPGGDRALEELAEELLQIENLPPRRIGIVQPGNENAPDANRNQPDLYS